MRKFLLIAVITTVLLTSCSLGAPAAPTVDPMISALESTIAVQNAAATMVAMQNEQTQAAIPITGATTEVPTAAPTATLAPTDVPPVRATATTNANCRFGPYSSFAKVGILNTGESADVMGKNTSNGLWWKVKLDSGVECWIFGDLVTITGDQNTVAVLVSPATPTPVPPPSWSGTWNILFSTSASDPEENVIAYTITMSQTGNTVSGSFSTAAGQVSFSGTVSTDGMSVSGGLQYGIFGSFAFGLRRVSANLDQFQGKFYRSNDPGIDGAFCGGTNGASYPSPCRY